MSTSYKQPGAILEFTAPSGGTTAGKGVLIGNLLVIATDTVAANAKFRGHVGGVHSHAKAASQAWTAGAVVYWDDTNKLFTNAATSGFYRAGIATAAVAGGAGDTTGEVLLTGEVTFALSATYTMR